MDLVTSETGDDETELKRGETGQNEPDLLPEYRHYRDEGCEFADSCLSCPFPQCFYDEPHGKQRWRRALRNKEIKRRYAGGWKVDELAKLFGVSQRTIQRALKSALPYQSRVMSESVTDNKKSAKGEQSINE